MTGADYFDEMMANIRRVADGLPLNMQAQTMLNMLNGAGVEAAAQLQSRGDFAACHDIIAMTAAAGTSLAMAMLNDDPDLLKYMVWAQARVSGEDVPMPGTVPQPPPPTNDVEATAWAMAAIDEAGWKPHKVSVVPVDHLCSFGGSIVACGKVTEEMFCLFDDVGCSTVFYCAAHAKVMGEAITLWRARRGTMTEAEVDAMTAEG